jgi:glycosyltransferase involved in cell wall biosynthesis
MMSPEAPPTWFILAHCFNMDGRAASQTITDRLPLLLARGIRPVVLSAPTGRKDGRFPHYRIMSLAPSGLLFEGRQLIDKHLAGAAGRLFCKTLLTILLLPFYLLEKLFLHLDSQWSWFLGATAYGWLLIRHYRSAAVIYSTAGPPSTHLAGCLLHLLTGLPWLAELHDPLVHRGRVEKGQRAAFYRLIEKKVCKHASTVIFFTESALTNAIARNPCLAGKGHTLRPGANPPDFSKASYRHGNKFHLAHFGSLGGDRSLVPIIKTLHGLLADRPAWRDLIRLDIYGADLDPDSKKALAAFPLLSTLAEHGRLEYDPETGKSGRERIIAAMRQSDVLLLLHGSGPVCDEYIPSKIYEYLLTGRPILALAARSTELEEMVRTTGHAYVPPDDEKAVKRLLADFVERWQTGGLPDRPAPSPYTIASAVESLTSLVRRITSC